MQGIFHKHIFFSYYILYAAMRTKRRDYMGKIIATVGSVTTAVRLEKLLRKNKGISSRVIHTPAIINAGGCSHSVTVDGKYLSQLKEVADKYGLKIRKIYMEEMYSGEKKYHAISG